MKGYNYYLKLVEEKKELSNTLRIIYNEISLIDSDDKVSRESLLDEIEYINKRLTEIKDELQ